MIQSLLRYPPHNSPHLVRYLHDVAVSLLAVEDKPVHARFVLVLIKIYVLSTILITSWEMMLPRTE